jgi:hypothetical protein
MRAYDEWRVEHGLPAHPRTTWGVASR